MAVEFRDFSFEVKAKIDDTTIAWLYKWANEIASHAKDNCTMTDDKGQLRGSYRAAVNEANGEAKIGSNLESAYWEEFGTGEHADTHKNGGREGRKGWWVYKDDYKGNGGDVLTEAQAKAIAAGDPTLHATNGRDPNYTLEKAFTKNKPKAIADLERTLKGL